MPRAAHVAEPLAWNPIEDPADRFSTGIADFDRWLGGGYRRGSVAIFRTDGSVSPADLHVLFTPTWLNFLYQSRGILAVLPARESPQEFREGLLPYVSRRRFDSRVRIVDYIGEGGESPYVVPILGGARTPAAPKARDQQIARMVVAERAVRGATARPFLEYNALEVAETLFGPETAARMHFHGIKRTRSVKNLGLVVAREGLVNVDAARSLCDYEFALRRDDIGLILRGERPRISEHVLIPDRTRGAPHLCFLPTP